MRVTDFIPQDARSGHRAPLARGGAGATAGLLHADGCYAGRELQCNQQRHLHLRPQLHQERAMHLSGGGDYQRERDDL